MTGLREPAPPVVAHRGNAADFPENTLPAFVSALQGGLCWVELDVQLSADAVPYVIHDIRLERTTDSAGDLRQLSSGQLDGVDACEPRRFGTGRRGTPLPRLAQFAALLARHPQGAAFVELKRASLSHHGAARCVERVLDALVPVVERCVLISFDLQALGVARAASGRPIGWVIERFDGSALDGLSALQPEFAFYDYLKRPAALQRLPAGPWQWAAYEVKTAARAREEGRCGAALVESMAPLRLQAELAATSHDGP